MNNTTAIKLPHYFNKNKPLTTLKSQRKKMKTQTNKTAKNTIVAVCDNHTFKLVSTPKIVL